MVMAGVLLLFLVVGLYFGWGVFQWFRLAWNLWKPAPTGLSGEELRRRRAEARPPRAQEPKLWN